jgi:hypothetical protein
MKQYVIAIVAAAALYMPAAALDKDAPTPAAGVFPVKFSAVVDMQVEKKMYDEYGSNFNSTRFTYANLIGYRQAFDDFWLRVALKGSCNLKYLESAFNVRFYPYWTMRRKVYEPNPTGGGGLSTAPDLQGYLDVLELNQAYIKGFKEYAPRTGLTFKPHLKVGRDGLLNGCSQLFGNYLDLPAGGYGASRTENVVGPFKNRKIFANQLEAAFSYNIFDYVSGTVSLMVGANANNEKFYQSSTTQYWQLLDSKMTAGFFRAYEDVYIWNKRFHIGGGFKKYQAPIDSAGVLIANTYTAGQWLFEASIFKDVKFYTEMAVQKLSSDASTGIVRPINIGITLPTFGVLDTLAIEWENVAPTYFWHNPVYCIVKDQPLFDPRSMRDPVAGRLGTRALGWGIVIEKRYFDRFVIDWGLYTGNPTGDMKTTLRLTSNF